MLHPECAALLERSQRVMGGGPATLSKLANRYPWPTAPAFLSYGKGAIVTCPDGHSYVDTVSALGPVILGYDDVAVGLAVMEQVIKLMSSTLSTSLECEVAEMLCTIVPGAEMCRFACNGKDVTEAAIKLARYTTGKRHVIYVGYAGGFADYLITTDKCGGILANITMYNHQIPWRDFEALGRVIDMAKDDLAAIILEVPPEKLDVSKEDTASTLRRYADAAHAKNAIFILDEIVTGLRYGLSGAQGYYGVEADLITMSKALGNGVPIAALLGPRDLMQAFDGGKVFLSTTFGSHGLGLAAAKATLLELQKRDTLEHLRTHGEEIVIAIEGMIGDYSLPVMMRGNFARFVFDWQSVDEVASADALRTLWLQELVKHGVLAGVPWFPMICYDEEIVKKIRNAVWHACEVLHAVVHDGKAIGEALECPVITDVFSSRYQENEHQ